MLEIDDEWMLVDSMEKKLSWAERMERKKIIDEKRMEEQIRRKDTLDAELSKRSGSGSRSPKQKSKTSEA